MNGLPRSDRSLFGRIVLDDDCVLRELNDTAAGWLGYTSGELLGQRLEAILDAPERIYLHSQILPVLKLQGWLEELYLRFRDKHGAWIPVLINARRQLADGAAFNEFAFVRMRQRARLEGELLHAKKLAEQASDAKTKFLAMMSHELRTPLQTIALGTEMLIRGEFGALTEDQLETLRSSESATATLVDLIDDILSFARMRTGRIPIALETVSVDDALDRAELLIRDRLQEDGLSYERQLATPSFAVRGDRKRVQQILLNLLNNAMKFTPAGGRITASCNRADTWGFIQVSDTGPGIPADQLQRIFEPFVQLDSPVQQTNKNGIGLGLAICRDLAHAMGGDLTVRSTFGEGSTFILSLPLAS